MLSLTGTIGPSTPTRKDDVLAMKSALTEVGAYQAPTGEIDEWPDTPLFEGLKQFQSSNALAVDGVANPKGPTEKTLNSALASKRLAAMSKPEKPSPTTSAPQRTQKQPIHQGLSLQSSVGPGQANRQHDMQTIQNALAWTEYPTPTKPDNRSESTMDDLTWRIAGFQRDFGLKQDGIIHPNGETATTINRLIQPLLDYAASQSQEVDYPTVTTTASETSDHTRSQPGSNGPIEEQTENGTASVETCEGYVQAIRRSREKEQQLYREFRFLEKDLTQLTQQEQAEFARIVENSAEMVGTATVEILERIKNRGTRRPKTQSRKPRNRSLEFFLNGADLIQEAGNWFVTQDMLDAQAKIRDQKWKDYTEASLQVGETISYAKQLGCMILDSQTRPRN